MVSIMQSVSDEWLQQRDYEEWQRICSLTAEELDFRLQSLGYDPVALMVRLNKRIKEAFAKMGVEWEPRDE